ncbi:MAG: hypothetical protein QM804_10290 [Propionicimonas sp.]
MVTAAEVAEARRMLSDLAETAKSALLAELADLPSPDQIARMTAEQITDLYKSIRDRWWMVADAYGATAATLGQEQALAMLDDIGHPAPAVGAVRAIRDEQAASAALTFALGQDDWETGLLAALDSHLMDANATAIATTGQMAGAVIYWVPSGAKTCTYCLERAAHGAYIDFATEAQRQGIQTRPHSGCDCRVILGADEYDWPEGFNPNAYAQTVHERNRERLDRRMERIQTGQRRPGPKTGQERRRNRSAEAWGDRQRIKAERDAAKKRLSRAEAKGDTEAEAKAREVLDRTAAERDRLNGNQ